MKRLTLIIAIAALCLSESAVLVRAETAYIIDLIRVAVRSGPGNEQKSLGLVESGNAVEVLKPGEEWSFVRMANGTEGYILTRYLTAQQPGKYRFDQIQEKSKTLTAQAAALTDENARLKAENEKLTAAVRAGQTESSALRSEFETFKRQASDYVALKTKNDELSAELAKREDMIAQLEAGSDEVLTRGNLYWFLAGGGVLLAGFLTGFSVKRQRRWSSSLT